ncbi:phasin family protein [Parapedomonas caeni]
MSTKTKTPTEAVEKAMEAGKERLEQAVKAGTETATKNFEKAVEMSKKQMDEAMKAFDEFSTFQKGNVEAVVASGQAAAKAVEELSKVAADYSKKALADAQATAKSLTAAKNAKEFMEIQNASLKSHYDAFVAETSKATELGFKVMSDIFEPLSTRMAIALEKVTKTAAK